MSVPGSANDPSYYGESSKPACSCSSGNERSCPIHHPQRPVQQTQQASTIAFQQPSMQAYPRPVAYPHHIADHRLTSMAANAPVYAQSFDPNATSAHTMDPRPQPVNYLAQSGTSSGMVPYHYATPARAQVQPQVQPYTVSPHAVWTQGSPSQPMPAIEVPSAGQFSSQQLAHVHESSTLFSPQPAAGLPALPNIPTSASSSSFSSMRTDSYSPLQAAPTSPAEALSWNMLHQEAGVRPQTSSSFASSSQGTYPFAHQAVGIVSNQSPMSMGWVQPSVDRHGAVKAETLPPNSPGIPDDDLSIMHRHVSAPSTPLTALESGRAYSLADFRPGPSRLGQEVHAASMLPGAQQLQFAHQPGLDALPLLHGGYSTLSSARPATSPGLVVDPSPVPYLDRIFGNDDAKYEAVLSRSHAADRAFVCAATTTRIYCRPSCAAKRPDRTRLRFFSNPNGAEKAEQAGFRPCKRCKPQTPGTADQCVLAVGECARHMVMTARNPAAGTGNDDDDDEIRRGTLKEYSARANLSAFHFHRTFKAVTSVTLGELGKALNTLALHDALGEWQPPVMQHHLAGPSSFPMRASPPPAEDIAHLLVGWSARRARRALGGLAPTVYAAGCPDAVVRYVTCDSAFGPVAIAYLDRAPSDMGTFGRLSSSPMPVAIEEGPSYFDQYSSSSHVLSTPAEGLTPKPPINSILLTCVLGQDAATTIQRRFPTAVAMPSLVPWLVGLIEELHRTGSREVQLPPEIVGAVRRARVYIEIVHQLSPKRSSSETGLGIDQLGP